VFEHDVAAEVRRLADEIRSVADGGLRYSLDLPYDSERYRHFRRIAAELMALVDTRDTDAIETELFSMLTHVAPVPVASAAVFDSADRILLIQRADNGEWEMPGGGVEPGESPAQTAQREAAEEAGVLATATDLICVLDTRLEGGSPIQMIHHGFLCQFDGLADSGPTTPHEVLAVEWFGVDDLPPLRPRDAARVAQAFDCAAQPPTRRRTRFDREALPSTSGDAS